MSTKLAALAVVAGHEIRARLRDGTAVLIAFVAPVVLATLFGVALGGEDDQPLDTTIGVVDNDGGDIPAAVQREAMDNDQLRDMLRFERLPDTASARHAVDEGSVGAAIVFDAGFSDSVSSGRGGEVAVLESNEAPYAGVVARSLVDQVSSLVGARTLAVDVSLAAGVPPDRVADFVHENGADGPALTLSDDTVAGAEVGMTVHYGAGMAVMFAFFVAGTSARALLTDRQLGTLDRMRAAPVPAWAPLAGKAVVGFLLALVSMCTTWLSSELIFGVSWGAPAAVLLLLLAHVFAATMLVLLVASRARTDAQVDGYVLGLAFVLALLGGSIVPVYDLPDVLQAAALVTPNGWVSRGLGELAVAGSGVGDVALPIVVLLGIGVVAGVPAFLRFSKGRFA
ncbi:ABC transporter permease [Prauserella rugosa]|uniref:ABC-2 type transport system permease protein n=1 Tax=Prauserella rugosa TaxID=43354 RepID=A0A660C9V5_9PSEU|nr:ABC transporter permease [Prauserella rugosa]KMS90413.1 multidrug ABC transporter permease [Streptomyces regensis]TWH20262.1 ABC-2 type transport system permease protein [Prauserella rugosa]